jgi:hypothetical protein
MPRTSPFAIVARYPIAFAALVVLVCGMAFALLPKRTERLGERCVDQALNDPSVVEAKGEEDRARAIETYYQNCLRNFARN